MGNTDSKTLSEGPAGQHNQTLNNSPSYMVQDGFHLLELHGGASIKFILIILVVALIDQAVKLGLRKRKAASIEHQYTKQMNGYALLSLIPTGNGRTNIYSPPPINPHRWVDQQALDLRLMEQQRLFEMLFRNAMRTQQTARVAPMPKAQIFEVPVDQNYPTFGYRLGKPNRWPDHILPQPNRSQTPDQNHGHDPRTPKKRRRFG